MADADGKPLPPLPPPDYAEHQYGPTGMVPPAPVPMHHPEYDEYADDGEYYHPDDYSSPDYAMDCNRLSTISERTERSEYSKHYPSARQVAYRDSISSNTEYGAFRGVCRKLSCQLLCLYPSPRITIHCDPSCTDTSPTSGLRFAVADVYTKTTERPGIRNARSTRTLTSPNTTLRPAV